MQEKLYATPCGKIHYWVNRDCGPEAVTLVFLPGLTADHRLFDKQITCFEGKYNLLVWDAPGHAASWPFRLTFTLMDKVRWLDEIFCQEALCQPVIVGQSMGGYVGQAYAELFPRKLKGFVAIDSAPLQRKYVTGIELWLLKRMEPVYRHYPWKSLLKTGSKGVATSAYGQALMHEMMMTYDGDQQRYRGVHMQFLEMLRHPELFSYYIFYHRPTNRSMCSRQGCAERVEIRPDGSIPQVCVTSCGLNDGPLAAKGTYPATICCHLYGKRTPTYSVRMLMGNKHPYITQDGPDWSPGNSGRPPQQYIANGRDGMTVVYRYFHCEGLTRIRVTVRGSARGRLLVKLAPDGKPVGAVDLVPARSWTAFSGLLSIPDDDHTLCLCYEGKGRLDLLEFSLS